MIACIPILLLFILFPFEYEILTPRLSRWTHTELLRIFKTVLQQTSVPLTLFLLIDGLDEYEGDKDDLLDLLDVIISTMGDKSRIQLCLSSRPWNVFEEAFGKSPNFRLQDLTYKDIRMYVAGSLYQRERMKELARVDSDSTSRLIEDIVERADGVFLWVKLVVKSLINGLRNYDNIMDLQKRLAKFPTDLEPLYRRMLDDIDDMYIEQAIKLFQIMQTIRKPPRVLSLWYADEGNVVKIDKFTSEYITPEDKVVRCKEVDGRLRCRCAGLLEIQFTGAFSYEETMQYGSLQAEARFPQSRFALVESTVQYLHQTVKDYLNKPDIASVLLRRCPNLQFDAHRWLQRSYLREISQLRGSPWQAFMSKRDAEPGMLWEPLDEFMYHTRKIEESTNVAQASLLESVDAMLKIEAEPILRQADLQPSRNNHWSGWCPARAPSSAMIASDNFRSNWNDSFLTYAVGSGLQKYVKEVLQRPGFRINDRRGRPLLHYAMNPGPGYLPCPEPLGMVEMLIRHGANPRLLFEEWGFSKPPTCALDIVKEKLKSPLSKIETQYFETLQEMMRNKGPQADSRTQTPCVEFSKNIFLNPSSVSPSDKSILYTEPQRQSMGRASEPPQANPLNTSGMSIDQPVESPRASSVATSERRVVSNTNQLRQKEGRNEAFPGRQETQTRASQRYHKRSGVTGCLFCFR